MAENPIELEFTYTRDEAVRSTAEVTRAVMPMMRVLPVIGAGIILSQLVYTRGTQLVFPFFIGLLLAAFPLFVRWTASRTFGRLPQANKVTRWTIGPETLVVESPLGTSQFVWAGVTRVRETKHGFLLFTHPRIAQWLPRGAFKSNEDLERLRGWIAARGISTRQPRASGFSARAKLILWAVIIAIIVGLYFYEPRSRDTDPDESHPIEAVP